MCGIEISTSYSKEQYRYKRYRFDRKILRQLRSCYILDNWHGFCEVFEDWFIILCSISLSLWVWRNCSIVFGVSCYVLVVIVIGSRQHGIADLLHQASHGTLARSKYLNFILGTVLSGYLVFQSFTGYKASHISNHHPKLGNPELDPDYRGLIDNHIYGENLNNGAIVSYVKCLLSFGKTLNYLAYLARYRMLNPDEKRFESLIRFLYLLVMLGLSIWFNCWQLVIVYWLVPLITTSSWVGSLVELFEHYPFMETVPKVDIYMSRNRFLPPIVNFFLGKHWDGYHLVHHLFPGIPSWKYKEAHQILLQDEVYANSQTSKGFWALWQELTLGNNLANGQKVKLG